MTKAIVLSFCYFVCLIAPMSFAQESTAVTESIQKDPKQTTPEAAPVNQSPQVGKHVMANMNPGNMILSLLMVLGLIVISALVLKRFNLTQQSSNQMSVVASLSLGAKERIVVVQIGKEQLVLGVSPQQISLLKELETPIETSSGKPLALSGNVLSFLQKNNVKADEVKKTET